MARALQARKCARAGPSEKGRASRAAAVRHSACVGRVQPLWIWAKASESESGTESDPSECCSACVRKVAARAPIRQPARNVPSAIRPGCCASKFSEGEIQLLTHKLRETALAFSATQSGSDHTTEVSEQVSDLTL